MSEKEFIDRLISAMTLKEKAAEITQLWGENPDGSLMGKLHGFHNDPMLAACAGSLLGFNGAERTISAQNYHIEENPHHIPFLFMTDVIHGYKTIFPSVLGLGATWDTDLVEKVARVSALEASVSGVHVTFSPMADLVRDARWGRVIESTGEDPWLNSEFVKAFVRGYQHNDLGEYGTVASCVKHYAGYGAVEGGRDYDSVQLGDYSLYNDYLPAFASAIDSGCEMVMPGFHTVNGLPCSIHTHLLQDVLRSELGFSGTVISDCTAICELISHGAASDDADAVQKSINAGVDIEMVSSLFYENIEKLVVDELIDIERINNAVKNILTLKYRLGLFSNPHRFADVNAEKKYHLCPEHRSLARESVYKSTVLIQNDSNLLPLTSGTKIALIGPYADNRNVLDTWGKVNGDEDACVTLLEGIASCKPLYSMGCTLWEMTDPYEVHKEDDKLLAEAIETALKCDVIVLALGEHPNISGESGSRDELTLPENQMLLLKKMAETQKPIAVILFAGRPLVLTEIEKFSKSLLYVWFPGTECGNGIADILFGRVFPTAKLPMSFPRSSGQEPLYYNHLPTGRPNTSTVYQAFKNGYTGTVNGPLHPFGFGLTYTSISLSEFKLNLSKTDNHNEMGLTASVQVKNTGNRSGTETIQLYIQDVSGTYSRPVKSLKAFKKVNLESGKLAVVKFNITKDMLMYYIPGKGWSLEYGLFKVYLGTDSSCNNGIMFRLTEGGIDIEN